VAIPANTYSMNRDEIHRAFLETRYIVNTGGEVVLRIGDPVRELLLRLPHIRTWAFLTAWNPLPDILPLSENRERNARMERDLITSGYRIHPGIGVSADGQWSEESLLVEDITAEAAREIAERFGQLAFVFGTAESGNALVYTHDQPDRDS